MITGRKIGGVILAIVAAVLATASAYGLTFGARVEVGEPTQAVQPPAPAGFTAVIPLPGVSFSLTLPSLRSATAVAAMVNGEPVYWTEVNDQVMRTALQYGVDLRGDQGAQRRRELTSLTIDQLVDQRLVLQAAHRLGVSVSEAEVSAEIERIIQNVGSSQEFQALLVQRNLSLEDVRHLLLITLTAKKLRPLVTDVHVPEDQVRRAYEANKSQYDRPEQVHVSHILVAVSQGQEVVAQAKVRLILARLQQGQAFADLARQFSDDPGTRDRGGDLGWVARGSLVPEFEKAAFALAPGQIGAPVRTSFGYHIILMLERRPAQHVTFEEARPRVQEKLLDEAREIAFQQWLQAERRRATIRRFDQGTK